MTTFCFVCVREKVCVCVTGVCVCERGIMIWRSLSDGSESRV